MTAGKQLLLLGRDVALGYLAFLLVVGWASLQGGILGGYEIMLIVSAILLVVLGLAVRRALLLRAMERRERESLRLSADARADG